jgi:hypothetical protein
MVFADRLWAHGGGRQLVVVSRLCFWWQSAEEQEQTPMLQTDINAKITAFDVPQPDRPQKSIQCCLSQLQVRVEDYQLNRILGIVAFFQTFDIRRQYSLIRPHTPTYAVHGVERAWLPWWKYAGNIFIDQHRKQAQQSTWPAIKQAANDRRTYIKLYIPTFLDRASKSISREQRKINKNEIRAIERKYAVEVLLVYVGAAISTAKCCNTYSQLA